MYFISRYSEENYVISNLYLLSEEMLKWQTLIPPSIMERFRRLTGRAWLRIICTAPPALVPSSKCISKYNCTVSPERWVTTPTYFYYSVVLCVHFWSLLEKVSKNHLLFSYTKFKLFSIHIIHNYIYST